jgi:hypothetical protein
MAAERWRLGLGEKITSPGEQSDKPDDRSYSTGYVPQKSIWGLVSIKAEGIEKEHTNPDRLHAGQRNGYYGGWLPMDGF